MNCSASSLFFDVFRMHILSNQMFEPSSGTQYARFSFCSMTVDASPEYMTAMIASPAII